MAYKVREKVSLEQLDYMKRYLAEETYDDYKAGEFTRRRMLKRLTYLFGSSTVVASFLVACGDPTATNVPTTTTAAATTTAPTTTVATTTAAPTTTVAITTAGAAAGATTTAAAPPPAATPGTAKGPLVVAANDPAVKGTDITFQSDTTIMAYMAEPVAQGTYPGIIAIHENRGLTDHIKDVTRRLAKAGYVAIAVDLLSREGGTEKVTFDKRPASLTAQGAQDKFIKDLNAGVAYLEGLKQVKPGKYGVVGFCFGGSYTLLLAASNPKIAAAVPYYGTTPQPPSLMAATNAAILGQYGGTDTRVNNTIPDLEKVMKDNNKTYEKKLWDGAGHAFNNDTGGSYNEVAAVNAWTNTTAWFNKYLK